LDSSTSFHFPLRPFSNLTLSSSVSTHPACQLLYPCYLALLLPLSLALVPCSVVSALLTPAPPLFSAHTSLIMSEAVDTKPAETVAPVVDATPAAVVEETPKVVSRIPHGPILLSYQSTGGSPQTYCTRLFPFQVHRLLVLQLIRRFSPLFPINRRRRLPLLPSLRRLLLPKR